MAALARVFETAGRARMPIIIHMRGLEPDYGEQDVRVFLQRVLPLARRIPVQIAHAGGWGGFDAATERALTAFADGITADPRNTRNLYFDLAGVGTRESTNERYARLASLVRRIGLRRFLMGSDWDALGAPERALRLARSSIPLSSEEWEAVLANRAPYMSLRRRNLATPAGRAVCAG